MPPPPETACVPVDEIRDYHRVNALVASLLDRGHRQLRLQGVSGQRLLLSGLRGSWNALIEIEGPSGPELAAELAAPGLLIVAHQGVATCAGRGLEAGRLVVWGAADDALGYRQNGGTIVALGTIGHRAGLELRSGLLVLGGPAGRLAGERQRGGVIVALDAALGPNAGRGRMGGEFARAGEPVRTSIHDSLVQTFDDLRLVFPSGWELPERFRTTGNILSGGDSG